jgi:hypothetical protein
VKISLDDSIDREGEGREGNSHRFRDHTTYAILTRNSNGLLNSSAVPKTETQMICVVRIAFEDGLSRI